MVTYIVVGGFILFDILTGLIKALYRNGVNSTYLRQGLYHKASEIIAVVGSGLLQYGIKYVNLGVDVPLLTVVSVYICVMELVSILENLAEVNPALAKLFKPYLEKLKGKEGTENGDKKRH